MPKPFVESSPYRGARVLVLGASGFVGRWVTRRLVAAGGHVTAAVRDVEEMRKTALSYGIAADIMPLDAAQPGALRALLAAIRPAIVFNMIGYGVARDERDEQTSSYVNIDIVAEVLSALAVHRDPAWNGQALIHAGSALEYGPNGGDLHEDAEHRPHTLYGRHKLAATRLVEAAQLPAITGRLFTVYGPGEHPGRLLPTLLEARYPQGVAELSPGDQQRDFTYVEDAAEGLCRLGLTVAPPSRTINVATGCLASVRQFVSIACEVLSIPTDRLRFGSITAKRDEIPHRSVSTGLLRQTIGWTPDTGIAAGIRRTVDFLDTLPHALSHTGGHA